PRRAKPKGGVAGVKEPADFERLARNIIVFGRALRANGFRAQPDRMILLTQALEAVGFASRDDAKAASRAVLARTADESKRFDAAFDAFWTAANADGGQSNARSEQRETQGRPRHDEPEQAVRPVRVAAPSSNAPPPS